MKKKHFSIIIILFLILLISAAAGLLFGSVPVAPSDVVKVLTGQIRAGTSYVLIVNVRIPRVLGGILAGIGLASAGVILQNVMNNSLASPNTVGINSGAGFFVMLCVLLFPSYPFFLPAASFLGAFFTTLLVFALAILCDNTRTTIILAGITISSFLNAGINTIKLLNSDITINLTTFLTGTLQGLTLNKLILPGILILLSFFAALFLAYPLNLLGMGDELARSLGLHVSAARFALLCLSSILAGSVVSYAGLLSFIGLIAPHICRSLFGNDVRRLLPCSALSGAILVLVCDLIGRTIVSPYELPAGIIMAFIGGPFFLYLLLKRRGGEKDHANLS